MRVPPARSKSFFRMLSSQNFCARDVIKHFQIRSFKKVCGQTVTGDGGGHRKMCNMMLSIESSKRGDIMICLLQKMERGVCNGLQVGDKY